MSESNTTTQQAIDEQRRLLEKRLPVDFKEVRCLGDMELLSVAPREIRLRTHIADDALNPRGFAHGGWLFTLCDASSGALVFSHGLDCVTQNASINYLHGGWPGDTVDIDARAALGPHDHRERGHAHQPGRPPTRRGHDDDVRHALGEPPRQPGDSLAPSPIVDVMVGDGAKLSENEATLTCGRAGLAHA